MWIFRSKLARGINVRWEYFVFSAWNDRDQFLLSSMFMAFHDDLTFWFEICASFYCSRWSKRGVLLAVYNAVALRTTARSWTATSQYKCLASVARFAHRKVMVSCCILIACNIKKITWCTGSQWIISYHGVFQSILFIRDYNARRIASRQFAASKCISKFDC